MSVGEAFMMSGQVYVLGIAIALGMAALIKLICFVIDRSDRKAEAKAQAAAGEGGGAK
ncbi:MAG: hypothetical protein FWG03_10200 [Clostridiales bacterium]|nr:hypothetical protein [Clostridiales bacterium]